MDRLFTKTLSRAELRHGIVSRCPSLLAVCLRLLDFFGPEYIPSGSYFVILDSEALRRRRSACVQSVN